MTTAVARVCCVKECASCDDGRAPGSHITLTALPTMPEHTDKNQPTISEHSAGTGYVVKSLEAALWAFQNAEDFGEAVLTAVNLGDDADTTGAVCGQLAGACWGESGIPAEWRDGLARKDIIEPILARLLDESE